MKPETKAGEVQGTETAQVNNVEVQNAETVQPEKKQQKVSISYTLKSFKENIKKLSEAKIVDEKDSETLKSIYIKAKEHWIGQEFDF